MANITRDQFDESKGVTRKVMQKGVLFADADFNEQMDILRRMDRRILSALTEHTNCRFGSGFLVEGTGASLAVTARAGVAAIQVGSQIAALIRLAEDQSIGGFTTWSASRTDYVYLDIHEDEVSASGDPNIINPSIGEETCRDIRLTAELKISEGGAPGTPGTGHTFVTLATVTKSSGSTINSGDVTEVLKDFFRDPEGLHVDGALAVDENAAVTGILSVTGAASFAGGADATGSLTKDGSEVFTHASTDIAAANLASNSVVTGKIADQNVTEPKIADGAVTQPKIGSSAVGTNNVADGAVTEPKVADGAITGAKVGSLAIGPGNLAADSVIPGKVSSSVAGVGLARQASGEFDVDGVRENGGAVELKFVTVEATNVNLDTPGLGTITGTGLPTNHKVHFMQVLIEVDNGGQKTHNLEEAGQFYIDDQGQVQWQRDAGGVFDSATYAAVTLRATIWFST